MLFKCSFCSASGLCKHQVSNELCHCLNIQQKNDMPLLDASLLTTNVENLRKFPFEGLEQINIANICSSDPMHDLPEGVIIDVLYTLFDDLRNKIRQLHFQMKVKFTKFDVELFFHKRFSQFYF